jgi:hypothetical protein
VQGQRYRITVRLDSGGRLTVDDTRDVNLRIGDRSAGDLRPVLRAVYSWEMARFEVLEVLGPN